jgi:hypothetical protein
MTIGMEAWRWAVGFLLDSNHDGWKTKNGIEREGCMPLLNCLNFARRNLTEKERGHARRMNKGEHKGSSTFSKT